MYLAMIKNFLITISPIIFFCFNVYGLEVTLTQGTVKPTPIAVTDFFSKDLRSQKIFPN